jgi:integrase
VPRVKTVRDEYVMYEPELKAMLKQLESNEKYIQGWYEVNETKVNQQTGQEETKRVKQWFKIDCLQTQCLLALLWIFGRRIMEVLMLKRKNIRVEGDSLVIQFRTLKRRKDTKELYEKSITLSHPYAHYIVKYIEGIKDPERFVFPGRSEPRKFVSRAMLPRTKEMKTYEYERTEHGFMSPQKAWKIIKFLDPFAFCHLFRHTLATYIARKGYNEDQLMAWFDWSTSRVAHEYVSRGKKIVEDLSTRTW